MSVLVISAYMRVREQHRVDGVAQNMVSVRGLVKSEVTPEKSGTAQIGGQLWTVAADEPIAPGVEVEVLARQGLTLRVKKINP